MFRVLNDSRLRTHYDKNIKSCELLKKIAANTFVKRTVSKSVAFVVSERDFIAIEHITKVSFIKITKILSGT